MILCLVIITTSRDSKLKRVATVTRISESFKLSVRLHAAGFLDSPISSSSNTMYLHVDHITNHDSAIECSTSCSLLTRPGVAFLDVCCGRPYRKHLKKLCLVWLRDYHVKPAVTIRSFFWLLFIGYTKSLLKSSSYKLS